MNERGSEKKLKRGLHDLSPLFQSSETPVTEKPSLSPVLFDVQFLAVCVPDHEGDAFLANAYVASQIVRRTNLFASLISITPGMNTFLSKTPEPFPALELLDSRISRLGLSHQELWSFTKKGAIETGSPSSGGEAHGSLVFLEFESTQFRSLARIALLLDRLVLFVQPRVENLREAYRLMKIFWNLNREIEFFLLFREREPEPEREEFMFERISLITSRFLGVSLGWLGGLAFPEANGRRRDFVSEGLQFHAESLLGTEGLKRPLSPEKSRFWNGILPIFQSRFHQEPILHPKYGQ